jgi:hypothetical protein
MLYQRTKQARTSRLVYDSPQKRNHIRTIQIRIPFPSTVSTLKLLSTAVGLRRVGMNVQTPVAGLRRVGRRNKNQSNPRTQSLVLQKLTELIKRPTICPPTLCLAAWLLIDPFPIAPGTESLSLSSLPEQERYLSPLP